MLYICHFFCLRVYALHFGWERETPIHSHPHLGASRLSSEAGWCPSGRIFGGGVEASWHHLQSLATTLGWGALGGGHNCWSQKKQGWPGTAQVTILGLNCHYNEWWFVGSSWKVWVRFWDFGAVVWSEVWVEVHTHPHSMSATPGFRRFPKDSEGFRPPCSTSSERWCSLFLSTMRCGCFRAHRRGWAEYLVGGSSILGQFLDQNGPFFMGWFYESSVAGQRMNQMHLIHWFQMPCNPCLRGAGKQQTHLYSRPLKGTMHHTFAKGSIHVQGDRDSSGCFGRVFTLW